MVTVTKRLSARFFALFLLSFSAHSSATTFLPHTNIPAQMADQITDRIKALPPVYEGDGFVIRHATPENYTAAGPELEANKEADASLKDKWFYSLNGNHALQNSLLALLGESHPNAWLESEDSYPERAYAVFKRAASAAEDTHIGFIHTAPGFKDGRSPGLTKLSYYIFPAHRGNGYATPMIKGFTEHLRRLQGQKLKQFTLPDSDTCKLAMRKLLAQDVKDKMPALTDLSITAEDVLFTETQAHISLWNPESFVAAHHAGMHLKATGRIWRPDSNRLTSLINPAGLTPDDLKTLQQDFNTVLVFSDISSGADTGSRRRSFAITTKSQRTLSQDSAGTVQLATVLQRALVPYAALDKDERPITGIDTLREAVMAHESSYTMFRD